MFLMMVYAVLVLPAYAGMIRGRHFRGLLFDGAPRVCGDDPNLKVPEQAFG